MRHLGSLLLALVLAPVTYLLLMRGTHRCTTAMAGIVSGSGTEWHTDLAAGAGLLALAGLLYSVPTLTRLSPVGPVLAGLALLAFGLWTMIDLAWFQAHRQLGPLRVHVDEPAGAAPMALVLGMPLLATALSPRRWLRRGDAPPASPPGAVPGYSPPGWPERGADPAAGDDPDRAHRL